jgi:hypothetical protein
MTALVPPAWREYQRRNRVAILSFVAGMPAIVAIFILAQALKVPNILALFPVALVVWVFVWARAAFRLVRWPCPRCKAPWLSGQPVEFSRHRRCGCCGLGLYEPSDQ